MRGRPGCRLELNLSAECDESRGTRDDVLRAILASRIITFIGDILAGLNVNPEPVLAAAQSNAIKTRLRAQTEEAQHLGIFGAPSFTTADGELFWGNDRLEQALRWAKAAERD